jgi:hypothetical protein
VSGDREGLDPETRALLESTDELLERTAPLAHEIRRERVERREQLGQAHERGEHGCDGARAVVHELCDGCWRDLMANHAGRTYDLRTIAGRLERHLDAVEARMAADPAKAWQLYATRRAIRDELDAEHEYRRPSEPDLQAER